MRACGVQSLRVTGRVNNAYHLNLVLHRYSSVTTSTISDGKPSYTSNRWDMSVEEDVYCQHKVKVTTAHVFHVQPSLLEVMHPG